jgi:hypothetical protein
VIDAVSSSITTAEFPGNAMACDTQAKLTIRAGTTIQQPVRIWTDETKTEPRNLTGKKIRMQVRKRAGDVPVLTFDTNNDTILTDPIAGVSLGVEFGEFVLKASSADTAPAILTPENRDTLYVFDAIMYDDSVVPQVVEGLIPTTNFMVLAPVTF